LVQGVALHGSFAPGDGLQGVEILAQPSAAHGAFFVHAVLAFGEDIGLAFVREQFHAHAGPRLLPVALEQGLLERGEFAFGCADETTHGRGASAHLPEHVLGRDAAIHDPDALGFAILILDFGEEVLERALVRGVAGEHLVSERETLGRDDQCDDHLHAVAAFVATVTKAAQAAGLLGRITFKVSAGKILEQHLVIRVKEIAPARGEMVKERALVREQPVVARIKMMLLREAEIAAEQVGDGTVIEPMPVQPPLGTRIDEPVKHERLQDEIPARTLATGVQALAPKSVEPELPPQLATQPASPPLARPAQRHRRQPHATRRNMMAQEVCHEMRSAITKVCTTSPFGNRPLAHQQLARTQRPKIVNTMVESANSG
jgi:hypothetical protein